MLPLEVVGPGGLSMLMLPSLLAAHQLESVLAGCNDNSGIQLQPDNSGTSLLVGGWLTAATAERFWSTMMMESKLYDFLTLIILFVLGPYKKY
jgi:hypothetical protein